MDTVILESVKGAWALSTSLPNGRAYNVNFVKEKEGERYLAEVPLVLTYKDFFGKDAVHSSNYPQDLLNSYNRKDSYGEVVDVNLRVIEIKKAPILDIPLVVEAPISKRRKKHETINS